ncbi:hypothetical protein F5880DRAFT_1510575 [Lentinula raphanica]|nr:hypothetical protein F5880DRAFT_1510575 [Lentinula raphanica]
MLWKRREVERGGEGKGGKSLEKRNAYYISLILQGEVEWCLEEEMQTFPPHLAVQSHPVLRWVIVYSKRGLIDGEAELELSSELLGKGRKAFGSQCGRVSTVSCDWVGGSQLQSDQWTTLGLHVLSICEIEKLKYLDMSICNDWVDSKRGLIDGEAELELTVPFRPHVQSQVTQAQNEQFTRGCHQSPRPVNTMTTKIKQNFLSWKGV